MYKRTHLTLSSLQQRFIHVSSGTVLGTFLNDAGSADAKRARHPQRPSAGMVSASNATFLIGSDGCAFVVLDTMAFFSTALTTSLYKRSRLVENS